MNARSLALAVGQLGAGLPQPVAGSAVARAGLLLGVRRAVAAVQAGVAVRVIGARGSAAQRIVVRGAEWLIEHQGWPIGLLVIAGVSVAARQLALALQRRVA